MNMNCLTSLSFTKPGVLSALSNKSSPPPHTDPHSDLKNKSNRLSLKHKERWPSVAEVEQVTRPAAFTGGDPSDRNSEQNMALFNWILSNSIGKSEGAVERKLRETGEWLIDGTQKASNSAAGRDILVFLFVWVLPAWMLVFLVASGIIKLPFSTPYLDDLIM